jgi:hypothetical protein
LTVDVVLKFFHGVEFFGVKLLHFFDLKIEQWMKYLGQKNPEFKESRISKY